MRALLLAALSIIASVSSETAVAQTAPPEPLSAFPQSLLSVRTRAHKVINFKIWTADNPAREQQGLMFIRHLDEHAGMLFMFPGDQPVTMWMKNTYIPLDMVFIAKNGTIDYIAANAEPLSLAIIGPPSPEAAVLELIGGAAERLGISVGDTVLHRNFEAPANHVSRKTDAAP